MKLAAEKPASPGARLWSQTQPQHVGRSAAFTPLQRYSDSQKLFPKGTDGGGLVWMGEEGFEGGGESGGEFVLGFGDEVPEPIGLEA